MVSGTLYLVATPIGNLEDITLRALRILKEVDLIACEDTRHTAKLLNHYGITTPRESYHEHNERIRSLRFIELLRNGKNIALVTDAGTPLLSDPGYVLVNTCLSEKTAVVPIPGPSAAIAALAGSGLPLERFYFAGFLDSRRNARKTDLQKLATIPITLVFYESPHRLLSTLDDMVALFGPRPACLVRELTKLHEEWLRGTLGEILADLRRRPKIQGEITLVVRGATNGTPRGAFTSSIQQHLEEEMQTTGLSRQAALKSVARQRGLSRKELYRQLLEEEEKGPTPHD